MIKGEKVEHVGSIIDGNDKCLNKRKREMATALVSVNKKNKTYFEQETNEPKKKKMKIISSCIFPVATYGWESYTKTKAEEKEVCSFKLKCYRKMH